MLKRLGLQEVLVLLVPGGSSERLAAPLTAQVGGGIMELFDNGAREDASHSSKQVFRGVWGFSERTVGPIGQTTSYSQLMWSAF